MVERTTISLGSKAMKAAKEMAEARRMKFSALIEEMIEHAADGPELPGANDADCLVELCERFAPTWANEMRARCEGVDQPKALEALLKLYVGGGSGITEQYLKAAEMPGRYGEKPPPR